jgi:hypothetical protein
MVKSILEMAKNRLTFYKETDETLLIDYQTEVYFLLQSYFKKTDLEVEVENTYKPLERILIADYTAYEFIKREILKNIAGEGGEAASGGKLLKKAKADVAETEFEYAKAEDGNRLVMRAGQILEELKKSICEKARTLGIALPLCTVAFDADDIRPFYSFSQ